MPERLKCSTVPRTAAFVFALAAVLMLACPASPSSAPSSKDHAAASPAGEATPPPAPDEPPVPKEAKASAGSPGGMAAIVADSVRANAEVQARRKEDAELMRPPDDPGLVPPGAPTTDSGITYQVLVEGTGPRPGPNDTVRIHLATWTPDGTALETTRGKEPKTVRMGKAQLPGLDEVLPLMREGETTRAWIPEAIASLRRIGEGPRMHQITLVEVLAAPTTPPDVAAPPPEATVTASGLAYTVLVPGTGTVHPDPHDRVKVHYSGWTTDGKMFDSSLTRGHASTFPLNRVIAGWTEGLQLMVVGDKIRLWIPEALAYGSKPGKPAGMLVFDVELIEIEEQPAPAPAPTTPPDVSRPPASASKTRSGLRYRLLDKGSGTEHPKATSVVKVHYSGWTTDGKMFDSSLTRGRPSSFPLNRVIAGWTEGLQLMVVGDKMRLWIPEALAYKGRPGKPAGMLVFDVELIEIEK